MRTQAGHEQFSGLIGLTDSCSAADRETFWIEVEVSVKYHVLALCAPPKW